MLGISLESGHYLSKMQHSYVFNWDLSDNQKSDKYLVTPRLIDSRSPYAIVQPLLAQDPPRSIEKKEWSSPNMAS